MGIVDAIRNRKLLRFSYEGYLRTVEPHAYGTDGQNHYLLRAYQIAGGSESGEYVGWKMFRGDGIVALKVTTDSFAGPRPDYKRGDRAIRNIIEEL
jgi:predicted DNA-binding transcriptional regulator YafY